MNRNETNDEAIREGEPPDSANTHSGGGIRPVSGREPLRQRPRPCWNIVSVLAPFAGLALAIPLGLLVVWITDSHGAATVKHSASIFAVALGVGLLSGGIALARSERLWGISIVGLAVNAAMLALLVYWDPWGGPF